jgi:phosphoglycolate phosphatase-like HAD superfamily hydrolase
MTQDYTNIQSQRAPVNGIIFDLDGTLIRSVVDFPKMKQQMIEFIKELPIEAPIYNVEQTTKEIINDVNERMIKRNINEEEREQIFHNLSAILTEVEFENISEVQLLPGVIELLNECQDTNVKMSILTRASGKYALECLERTGIKEFFSVVLSRDEFTLLRAKPHIVALNRTLKDLNIPPELTIFVGDHELDFECAKAGKIRFVGVLSGSYNRERFGKAGVQIMVQDFFELAELIKYLNDGFKA